MSLLLLREQLDSKKISAAELYSMYADRIEKKEKEVNSFITICSERAREQVKKAQAAIDKRESGPLTGIPLSVKDNICTQGIKTTCASRMLKDFVPIYNATVVDRLEKEQFVMMGKTNMDEFAMGSSGQTSYFGGVRNPYDKSRVSGGSSGGAAAGVAAGFCAAALGSDTGGSVRQPASFCGVVGLKPTYGAVSRYGLIAFASSLDQIGVLANSAADAGYVLNSIAGYDSNDATTSPKAGNQNLAKIGIDLKGMKIGIPKEFFSEGISEEVRANVLSAAEYYRRLGCELVNVSLPALPYAISAYYLISSAEAAANLSRFDGIKYGFRSESGEDYNELIKNTRREGFGDEVKRRIMLGNYALSSGYYDAYYQNASRIRQKICAEYREIFGRCDVILTPTAPDVAYPIGFLENDPVKMYISDICTVTVNIAGLPAISIPCSYDKSGMPIGFSLIGRAYDEATIIAVADRFETDFSRREAVL